ncbi:MAG: molybdopterin converting factor subunit 1, partial [Planctomycetes bacterium]|nr:molybdopterin converting factor subunit 1 [Planctomycetota bacterium]
MTDPNLPVTVRCFAAVREALGADELKLEVEPGTTVEGLRQLLIELAPTLARLPVAFAVNRDYARGETRLSAGDEVALIPPISGGSGSRDLYRFDLVDGAIDPRALEAECRTDADGAFALVLPPNSPDFEVLFVKRGYVHTVQRTSRLPLFPVQLGRARVV